MLLLSCSLALQLGQNQNPVRDDQIPAGLTIVFLTKGLSVEADTGEVEPFEGTLRVVTGNHLARSNLHEGKDIIRVCDGYNQISESYRSLMKMELNIALPHTGPTTDDLNSRVEFAEGTNSLE